MLMAELSTPFVCLGKVLIQVSAVMSVGCEGHPHPLTLQPSHLSDIGNDLYLVPLLSTILQYKKQDTLLHRVNGVIMLVTFFCCRLLLFPYMYWVYGQRVGLPLYRVPFNLSPEYNIGAAILMAPQVYWFYLICRRAYSLFQQSRMSQRHGHSPSAKDQDCSQ